MRLIHLMSEKLDPSPHENLFWGRLWWQLTREQCSQGRRKVVKSEEARRSEAQRAEVGGPKSRARSGFLERGQLALFSPFGGLGRVLSPGRNRFLCVF